MLAAFKKGIIGGVKVHVDRLQVTFYPSVFVVQDCCYAMLLNVTYKFHSVLTFSLLLSCLGLSSYTHEVLERWLLLNGILDFGSLTSFWYL